LRSALDSGDPGTDHTTSRRTAPAPAFRLTDRGRIQPGTRADPTLVDGDPTTDIPNTRNVVTVWKCGVRLDPAIAASRNGDTARDAAKRPPDDLDDVGLGVLRAGEHHPVDSGNIDYLDGMSSPVDRAGASLAT
jgi:hypothetical protein